MQWRFRDNSGNRGVPFRVSQVVRFRPFAALLTKTRVSLIVYIGAGNSGFVLTHEDQDDFTGS